MSYEYTTHPEPPKGSGPALGLGIAGMVIGILALLWSFIPCLGAWALWPGLLALVLSGVGLLLSLQAQKVDGFCVAGLCVSVVATGIAGYWYYKVNKGVKEWEKQGREFIKESERRRREREERNRNPDRNKTIRPEKSDRKTFSHFSPHGDDGWRTRIKQQPAIVRQLGRNTA